MEAKTIRIIGSDACEECAEYLPGGCGGKHAAMRECRVSHPVQPSDLPITTDGGLPLSWDDVDQANTLLNPSPTFWEVREFLGHKWTEWKKVEASYDSETDTGEEASEALSRWQRGIADGTLSAELRPLYSGPVVQSQKMIDDAVMAAITVVLHSLAASATSPKMMDGANANALLWSGSVLGSTSAKITMRDVRAVREAILAGRPTEVDAATQAKEQS